MTGTPCFCNCSPMLPIASRQKMAGSIRSWRWRMVSATSTSAPATCIRWRTKPTLIFELKMRFPDSIRLPRAQQYHRHFHTLDQGYRSVIGLTSRQFFGFACLESGRFLASPRLRVLAHALPLRGYDSVIPWRHQARWHQRTTKSTATMPDPTTWLIILSHIITFFVGKRLNPKSVERRLCAWLDTWHNVRDHLNRRRHS